MTKIFIADEIPSLNKGEAAILFGMLETFRTLGDVEVSLFSSHPEIDRPRYSDRVDVIDGVKDLHLRSSFDRLTIAGLLESLLIVLPQYFSFIILYKIFGSNALKIMKGKIWKSYYESDIIITNHDNTFSDFFGRPAFMSGYSLLFAKIFKKPIIIYASSVGPFKYKLQKAIGKFILNKMDLVTIRDEITYKYLQDIGTNMTHIHLTADTAYLLPSAPSERVTEIMLQEDIDKNKGPIVGMTVTKKICHLAFPDIENKEVRYKKSIMLLSQVVDYLTNTLNATVIFIPHSIGPSEELDDRIVANDICQLVKNKQGVKVITKEYTPKELKGIVVDQFDLIIGERLHSIVAAVSTYVPSIAVLNPSHRNQILKGVLDEKWMCDIKIIDFNTLISKIVDIWSEKEEIKKDLIDKVYVMKERALLNGELLKNLLKRCKRI